MQEINMTIGIEEVAISVCGGCHVRIKNRGDDTIYVSKYENIVAGKDNVIEIGSGEVDIIEDVCTNKIINNIMDWYGTIYILSEGTSKVAIRTQNHLNFRQTVKGGDDSTSTALDDVLKSNARYQLGVLTSNITITLPETATADIEVDFAIADTTYAITCDYLSLDVVANTYYQIFFSYDKVLKKWFSSVVSSDYVPVATMSEVTSDEAT